MWFLYALRDTDWDAPPVRLVMYVIDRASRIGREVEIQVFPIN